MSYPPGSNGPDSPNDRPGDDPWATPTDDQGGAGTPPERPGYPPQQSGYQQQPGYPPQPPQPPYGQPGYGYGYPVSQPPTNGKATAALWTGIGSIALSFCCIGALSGVVAIVLGIKARADIRQSGGQQQGDGLALAGIITGALAIVMGLAMLVLVGLAISSGESTYNLDSSPY